MDLAASRAMLATLMSHAANLKGYQILIDFRRGTARMSINDIWQVASELGRSEELIKRKIAILVGPDANMDHASFFETCVRNRFMVAKVFQEFEEAILWLVASDTQDVAKVST